jgi:hypothetical protein
VTTVSNRLERRARISDLLRSADVEDLLSLGRADVLSLHLDTDPTKPENQRPEPAYRIWARKSVLELAAGLGSSERKRLDELAERVDARLREDRPGGRGLVLYAADGLWREYVLPVGVENRVRYGFADLWPLLWVREAYTPYGVLLVHRDHARLWVTHLGEAELVEDEEFHLDPSQWRFASGKPPSFAKGMGMPASRGAQRDTFASRVEDHVRRFWSRVASAAGKAVEELGVGRLIVGGPPEAASAVCDLLPEPARRKLVGTVSVPPQEEWPAVRERVLEVAREDQRRRHHEVRDRLRNGEGPGGAVLGPEATLDALLRRQVLVLAADRDVEGRAWLCTGCEFATLRPDERCLTCGAGLVEASWTQVLPALAWRNDAQVVLLEPGLLREHGGVGALLRYR